ncbi:MAG: putative sterol carrier protein [Saprospiraceae bacterium]|jgi:putative sterol carrier protein
MSLDAILLKIKDQAANISPIGATVKFVLDEHILYVDGTGDANEISMENKDADCMITTSMDTFIKLKNGDLNPMMAMMTGKIKIKGDMAIAMKLQALLS